MKGKIHSIESCGTVDGPGIRCIVFFQGCPLRCRYCHNPDTWSINNGTEIDSNDIVKKILRFRPYFGDNGGVTLSGGEPLLQPDFASEILRKCKEEGIHTAVDTSGWVDTKALELVLPYTDLLLLDIKGLDEKLFEWITGKNKHKFTSALKYIQQAKTKIWLRYVVLPGINDSDEQINELRILIKNIGKQLQKIELIPYHQLGVHKWDKLQLNYSLKHLEIPDEKYITLINEELEKVRVESTT